MSSLSKKRLTIYPNGVAGFLVDNNAEEKSANYNVIINTDSGKEFISQLDGITFVLPSIAIGHTTTFTNIANDGEASLIVAPTETNGITYAGSSTNNVTLVNTKATARKGDFVTLASLDGTSAWQVVAVRGIWAKV